MILEVKVIPNARENGIVEFKDNVLKIKIKGVPVKGKVNDNLIKFLSDYFNVAKSEIKIISGSKDPRKRVAITGAEKNLLDRL